MHDVCREGGSSSSMRGAEIHPQWHWGAGTKDVDNQQGDTVGLSLHASSVCAYISTLSAALDSLTQCLCCLSMLCCLSVLCSLSLPVLLGSVCPSRTAPATRCCAAHVWDAGLLLAAGPQCVSAAGAKVLTGRGEGAEGLLSPWR